MGSSIKYILQWMWYQKIYGLRTSGWTIHQLRICSAWKGIRAGKMPRARKLEKCFACKKLGGGWYNKFFLIVCVYAKNYLKKSWEWPAVSAVAIATGAKQGRSLASFGGWKNAWSRNLGLIIDFPLPESSQSKVSNQKMQRLSHRLLFRHLVCRQPSLRNLKCSTYRTRHSRADSKIHGKRCCVNEIIPSFVQECPTPRTSIFSCEVSGNQRLNT